MPSKDYVWISTAWDPYNTELSDIIPEPPEPPADGLGNQTLGTSPLGGE